MARRREMPRTLTQRASRSRESQGRGRTVERERERSKERESAWTIYGWLLVIVCTVDQQGRMGTRLQRKGFSVVS